MFIYPSLLSQSLCKGTQELRDLFSFTLVYFSHTYRHHNGYRVAEFMTSDIPLGEKKEEP